MPPCALRTTAVLWRTDGISRLGEVLFITTICPVHHRISNRRESLITRIAEAITQWHSCMKEHTDSHYSHAVPRAKNSFLHCYFREPCPVIWKHCTHMHTHIHVTKTLQHEAESLACLLTQQLSRQLIVHPDWMHFGSLNKHLPHFYPSKFESISPRRIYTGYLPLSAMWYRAFCLLKSGCARQERTVTQHLTSAVTIPKSKGLSQLF